MKKISVLIAVILIFSCCSISVSADSILNYQKLSEASEYSEISNLTQEIVNSVNGFYERNLAKLPRKVTSEDVDFSKAVKIYGIWDTSYLYTNSKEKLLEGLEKDGYDWELPIDIDGTKIIVEISKIKLIPKDKEHLLSKRGLEKNKREAGQWHVTSWDFEPTCTDYISKINNIVAASKTPIEKSDVVFAIGYPNFGAISAIVMSENTVDYFVPVFKPFAVDVPNDTTNSSAIEKYNSQISENSVFAYSDIIDLLKAIPPRANTGELSAGALSAQRENPLSQNCSYAFIIFGCISFFSLIIVVSVKINTKRQK